VLRVALLFSSLFLVVGCSGAPGKGAPKRFTHETALAPSAAPGTGESAAAPTGVAHAKAIAGDPENGAKLVSSFECNRCHDGTGHPAMATEKHCTHCHEDISTGRFGAGTAKIGIWRKSVAPYRYTPSLDAAGKRFRRAWIEDFLKNPYDLRPHLAATMPRLQMTDAQAADIAAYLTQGAADDAGLDETGANPGAGRSLIEGKGCGSCHEFSGVNPLPARPDVARASEKTKKAIQLAPDLRHARERFRLDGLVDWLLAPQAVKADTEMPSHSLTRTEARDIAAYLIRSELSPPPTDHRAERLPLLSRRVTYREVEERVLSVTCRHCHTDPDAAGGDGGPGNTGGFGFRARGLDLSTYGSVAAGYLDDSGERRSVFAKDENGVPVLVAALLARHDEGTRSIPKTRGMPLGLPAVPLEDVQLVDTWIAQGRPR
jgi:cytochrome c2